MHRKPTAAGPPPAWRTTNTKAGTDSHGLPCPGFGAAGGRHGKMKPTTGFSQGCYFTRAHKPHPSHTCALTCKSPLHTSHPHKHGSLSSCSKTRPPHVGGDGTACNREGPRAHSSPRRPPAHTASARRLLGEQTRLRNRSLDRDAVGSRERLPTPPRPRRRRGPPTPMALPRRTCSSEKGGPCSRRAR